MRRLEAAIAADVDGTDPYLVYADWLQTQGDPRGELITLQAAKPNARVRKAEAAFLAKHHDAFVGTFGRGLAVTWHLGFFKSMRITWPDESNPADSIHEIVPRALQLASAKYVRHIAFGKTDGGGSPVQYGVLARQLSKMKLPFLRSLYFGDFGDDDWDRSWTAVGPLAPIYRGFPKLEKLGVRGNNIALGKLEHANLRELEIRTDSPAAPIVTSLCAAKLPKLERLVVDLGGSSNRIPSLRPILDGRFPSLRHLALEWTSPSRDDLEALGKGKTLAKLQTLSLASCALTDTKVEMLLAHAARYEHLTAFDLDNNHLSAKTQKLVKKLGKGVDLGNQQKPGALWEWE